MFMRSKWILVLCCTPISLLAQARLDPRSTMHITFPEDSPLAVVSADWGESTAAPRAGAMLLDLKTSLVLKNIARRPIRGVTLLVKAQEGTPGGKASVSVPSLNVAPGESFPVRIDLRLVRPALPNEAPSVEVSLDGVLFDDLSFYGPDRLNSRRMMTVWELEARRDREYFRSVLQRGGPAELRRALLESLAHHSESAATHARVARSLPATNVTAERLVQIAFLHPPEAPVGALDGAIHVAGEQIRAPRIVLQSRSNQPIKSVELGWMVRDSAGREYVGGLLPLNVRLEPGGRRTAMPDAAFRLSQANGRPLTIESMTAFINSVEFADGSIWVVPRIPNLPLVSPEEQRLAELYRKRGLEAVIEDLRRSR